MEWEVNEMDKVKLEALLTLIVPQVVAEIIKVEGVPEAVASEQFLESRLYSELEIEETKLWHLSPQCLYQMYCEERETGEITYPEGV